MLGLGGIAGIGLTLYMEVALPPKMETVNLPVSGIATAMLGIAAMLGIFSLCAWVGFELWKQKPRAFTWAKVLLIAQIPYCNFPFLVYKFYTGAAIDLGITRQPDTTMNFQLRVGSGFSFGYQSDVFVFGINLVAPVALYLLGKAIALRKEPAIPASSD